MVTQPKHKEPCHRCGDFFDIDSMEEVDLVFFGFENPKGTHEKVYFCKGCQNDGA